MAKPYVLQKIEELDNNVTNLDTNVTAVTSEVESLEQSVTTHLAETAYYEIYYKSMAQSIPNGVPTSITVQQRNVFGGIDKNFSVIESNGIKILVPGMYFIVAHLMYASNPNGYRQVNIASEGVTFTAINEKAQIFFARPYIITTANTMLTLATYQNSGGALDLESAAIYVLKL